MCIMSSFIIKYMFKKKKFLVGHILDRLYIYYYFNFIVDILVNVWKVINVIMPLFVSI